MLCNSNAGKAYVNITTGPFLHLRGETPMWHVAVMSSVDTATFSKPPLRFLLQRQSCIFSSCLHSRWARSCDAVDAPTQPFPLIHAAKIRGPGLCIQPGSMQAKRRQKPGGWCSCQRLPTMHLQILCNSWTYTMEAKQQDQCNFQHGLGPQGAFLNIFKFYFHNFSSYLNLKIQSCSFCSAFFPNLLTCDLTYLV